MKWFAIILNLIVGVILLVELVNGITEGDPVDMYFFILIFMFLTLISNLWVLFNIKDNGKTWIELYFKRKILEETKKIEDLEKITK
jgi:hypothetical protein